MNLKALKNKISILTPISKLQTSNKGFTIIEILVVFTVIAILAGIGITSFVAYSRSQQINQTANNLKLLINEAKFNSLSVVKSTKSEDGSVASCDGEALTGYIITISGSSEIRLSQMCESSGSSTIKTISLPSGISIVSANPLVNCSIIQFGSLSGNVSGVPGVPCSIRLTGFNQSKTVTVDAIGNTSVQ